MATVRVIGNCTLDLSFRIERFPLAGETLLSEQRTRDIGGKGANQAVVAARMGVDVAFCSAVGDDADGRLIVAGLEQDGVDTRHVGQSPVETDVSIIYVTSGGENAIVSTHAAAQAMTQADVDAALVEAEPGDILLMQGNLDRGVTEHSLRQARRGGLTTVVNPAPIHYDFSAMWPLVDYVVPNEVELRTLTTESDVIAGAERLRDLGVSHVVVTLGAAGAACFDHTGERRFAAEAVEAVDTTGAGDVFCGVAAAAMALGRSLDEAISAGVRAATLSVTRAGTRKGFPSAAELAALTDEPTGRSAGR